MSSHFILAVVSLGCALAVHRIGMSPSATWAMSAVFGVFAIWQVACGVSARPGRLRAKPILTLGGFSWSLNDFCRGWLVTGETGSGKTLSAINAMLWQVSKNCPNWGGICIDDKGLYWETLSAMFRHLGREEDLILLQVRPDGAPADWEPPHTFNYLDDARLPYSAKAKDVCDVASSLGQDGDQSFFKTQAEIQMGFAFQALACAGMDVTLNNAYDLLSSDDEMQDIIDMLDDRNTPESRELMDHYHTQIASQPAEQLGGVRGTLANRLKHFTPPDIARVFCPKKSTLSFSDIDRGKVICISIPQRFKTERRYIHTLLKLAFYSHVLLRFDRPSKARAGDNLLVLWADEAQKIVTANHDGTSDYNVVDVMREAKATVVAATQSYTSLIPPIGDEKKAKVFIANMANRVMFKAADEESAKIAADTLGKKKYRKRTYGYSAGKRTTSVSEEEKYYIEPHEFRRLRKFQAVVQHCEMGFRRVTLPPREADGRVSGWFR
ncbi:type IV secretory pathway TraG/TraD family ATPase VirD4 [Ereboglobus sp. PH5-5]|uniref:type IV secretory system conjugative DNA transfer family protein n=1 Tax=Ereboglobus sp. PH5-5 TaxID=2940529 RepID=UPI00240505E6|nr:type IV secretion system DNA-binding domain-containing protein [Ereboglobus sp. PH5-5]MDF9832349.1 type IV secretory pathway TraG/TraD family ATPase VirD4 [Ereboglobus sp. PH5-5]